MKKNAHSKKRHAKSAPKNPPLEIPVPAPPPIAPSAVSPLAGEALELKVADKMCEGFRATPARTALRDACGGAEHSAIEAAIVSPRVRSVVEPVTLAYACEHTNDVIRLLLTNARAALVVEKPTPAQILALKIVFETLVEKRMVRIEGGLWQDSFNLLGLSDFEKSVVDDTLQLMRRLRAPTTSESPDCDVPVIADREPIEQAATEGA